MNVSIETLMTLPADIKLLNPLKLNIKYTCLPFYSKVNYDKDLI